MCFPLFPSLRCLVFNYTLRKIYCATCTCLSFKRQHIYVKVKPKRGKNLYCNAKTLVSFRKGNKKGWKQWKLHACSWVMLFYLFLSSKFNDFKYSLYLELMQSLIYWILLYIIYYITNYNNNVWLVSMTNRCMGFASYSQWFLYHYPWKLLPFSSLITRSFMCPQVNKFIHECSLLLSVLWPNPFELIWGLVECL